MDLNLFISKVEEQFSEAEPGSFTSSTKFKERIEWGSLTALMIVAMADQDFNKRITGEMFESSETIEDLFNQMSK